MLHIRRVCCSVMDWITLGASLENYNKQTNSKRRNSILWYDMNICHWSGFNGMCSISWANTCVLSVILKIDPNCHQAGSQIAKFMGPTWGPSGVDRTQVGLMLAPWSLLSGVLCHHSVNTLVFWGLFFSACHLWWCWIHSIPKECRQWYDYWYPGSCITRTSTGIVLTVWDKQGAA